MDEEPSNFPRQHFQDDEEGGGEAQGQGFGDTEDSPDHAPPQRGFEKPRRRAEENVLNDDDEHEDEDEEDGIDLMRGSGGFVGSDGGEDDSSEEEDDDPEEAKLIAEGFIVDEEDLEQSDDDAAEKRKKKKRRLRKLRRRKQQQEEEGLDEDDLALVAENRGGPRSQQKKKRFRRGSASPEPQASRGRDLARIFDDDDEEEDGARLQSNVAVGNDEEEDDEDLPSVSNALRRSTSRKQARGQVTQPATYALEDDMEDFIDDDDESDEAEAMADLDEDEREARRQEKRERKKAEKAARRAGRGGIGEGMDPNKAGIDEDAWDELQEIFGNGDDYNWAFKKGDLSDEEAGEDLEEQDEVGILASKKVEFKDIFEPAAIQERMLTEADDRVKQIDWPERFQLALPGEEGLRLLETQVESADLDRATLWIAPRISTRCHNDFNTPGGVYFHLRQPWLSAIRLVLEYILMDRLEVPFLYSHRSDQLTHETPYTDPATGRTRSISYLTRRELHIVTSLAFRWKTLHNRKVATRKTFEQIGSSSHEDLGKTVAQTALFESMLDRVDSLEELSDLIEWLTMRYGARMRDAQIRQLESEADPKGVGPSSFKRPSVMGQYERIKSTAISELAKRFGISSSEISENFLAGAAARRYFPDDETQPPEVLANEFVDERAGAKTADSALNLARIMVSAEIGREPLLRVEARNIYRDHAQITVRPTEKGSLIIDEEHPFWNFKYLQEKPVKDFISFEPPPRPAATAYGGRLPTQPVPSQTQYLLMLQAEEENLVTLEIALPMSVERDFSDRLYQSFASEGVSEISQMWNSLRRRAIDRALQESLLPAGRIWVREWLKEECSEWLCRSCEAVLDRRLDSRPYESASMRARRRFPDDAESDDGRGDASNSEASKGVLVPSVLAVSHGKGDPKRDAVAAVFLDAAGRFRSSATFDTITQPTSEQQAALEAAQQAQVARAARRGEEAPEFLTPRQQFLEMIKRLRPDVIVLNGFSPKTIQLKQQLELLAQEAKQELIAEQRIPAEQADKASIDVIYVHDDTARLYQHSQRAADEFPDLKILQRYCLGLARYAQSPLLEFAALGNDLMVINFDPHQRLVSQDRLRMFLERSIVSCTNEVGVNLNKAVGDAYYRHLLPFVCGLGPRKARALVDAISKKLEGTVVNRRGLLDHQILSWPIFVNASAFLHINIGTSDLGLRSSRVEPSERDRKLPDVLDRSRIHPEDYKYARKMAADALNLDEEDLEGEHSSHPCALLFEDPEPARKLRDLDINSYAEVLLQKSGERKKLTLEQCLDELIRPFGEVRGPFKVPTPDEMLTILTGETTRTLDRESIVNVTVSGVFPTHVTVRLDCGIEGTINEQYLIPLESQEYLDMGQKPPKPRQLVKRDQTLKAQIIDIDKEKLQVELTAKPSHLVAAENMRLQNVSVAVDPRYWSLERAEKERRQAEFKKQAAKSRNNVSRFIRHPNFRNFNAGQSEEFLATQLRGAVIIRPSSKGSDHLAVTWKVDDEIYQHLDVLELEKENEYSLGKILRVSGVTYNDLDELIVNHVNPMAKMVEMMINHEKYKGSEKELEQYLTNWCLANPTRSTYAFGIDPKHPGCFKLGFKANREAPIQYWPVKVLPGRYKLHQADHLPDVASLSNAFKTQYTAMAAGARGGVTPGNQAYTPAYPTGSRTPYGAAGGMGMRTPMHGGMTPGRMATGGMTPAGNYGGMPSHVPPPRLAPGGPPMPPGAPPRPPGPPPSMPGPPPSFPGGYGQGSAGEGYVNGNGPTQGRRW